MWKMLITKNRIVLMTLILHWSGCVQELKAWCSFIRILVGNVVWGEYKRLHLMRSSSPNWNGMEKNISCWRSNFAMYKQYEYLRLFCSKFSSRFHVFLVFYNLFPWGFRANSLQNSAYWPDLIVFVWPCVWSFVTYPHVWLFFELLVVTLW